MSPEKRREQILDSAVALIIARGLSACTLESVAVQADISKPLIYKYFPRLEDLLRAVVDREYDFLRGRRLMALPKDMPYEEIVHRSNLRTMEYFYERGPIIRIIASDRSVSGLVQSRDRDERQVITSYFIKRCMKDYAMQSDVAAVCVMMTVNAPILTARALKRSGISAKRAADVWSEFIIGGNKAVQAKFAARKRGNVSPRSKKAVRKSR
jgi:AcrR family transcriptional regulator